MRITFQNHNLYCQNIFSLCLSNSSFSWWKYIKIKKIKNKTGKRNSMPVRALRRDHLRSTSGITCDSGSFKVQFGDHLRSGIISGAVQWPWQVVRAKFFRSYGEKIIVLFTAVVIIGNERKKQTYCLVVTHRDGGGVLGQNSGTLDDSLSLVVESTRIFSHNPPPVPVCKIFAPKRV